MPATPTRSNAFTPPPSSGDTGIMSDLYRHSVGPLNAAYYQQQFSHFEALGKAVPTWNHGAAFCTLAWLVLRKLWRPAGMYAAVLLALVLLWAFALHARVPMPVEAAICLLTLLLLCVVPGFLATGWYYQQVRSQTLSTLTAASSIGQARTKLAHHAASKERLYMVAGVQTAVGLALAALVYSLWGHASADTPAVAPQSGPPDLVIPEVSSLYSPASDAPLSEPVLQDVVTTPVASLSDAQSASAATLLVAEAATPAAPQAVAPQPPAAEMLAVVPAENSVPAAPLVEVATTTAAATAATAAVVSSAPPPAEPPQPAAKKATAKQAAPASSAPATKAPNSTKTAAAGKTKTATEPAPAATTGRLIPGKFYLNAGVYAEAANVDRSVKQLQALQLPTLRQTVSSSKGDLTRLRIGPFDTRKQAEQAVVRVKKLRIDATVFQQPKK